MKRFAFLIFGAILFPGPVQQVFSQLYTPMDFSEGATWSHTECGYKPGWGAVYKLRIKGDTILDNKVYEKIFYQAKTGFGVCSDCEFIFDPDSAQVFAFLRQDIIRKKVYFIYPFISNDEWLGYDFDIPGVGSMVVGFSLIFSTQREFSAAGIYIYQMRVDAIDSLCVDGTYRKRYFFGSGESDDYHTPEFWIEGIGSTQGILVQGYGAPNWDQNLYCFYNNTGPVYFDSTGINPCIVDSTVYCIDGMDCSPITPVQYPAKQVDIRIFPNPSHDKITVTYSGIDSQGEIQILNILGKAVASLTNITSSSGSTTISVTNWPEGVYYLTLRTPQTFLVKKIIRD